MSVSNVSQTLTALSSPSYKPCKNHISYSNRNDFERLDLVIYHKFESNPTLLH